MAQQKAAIPADETLSRSLSDMSAAEFVQLLGRTDIVDRRAIAMLPDKKKYELWVDEEVVLKKPVGDLLDLLKGEKKKLELEKFPIENIKLSIEEVVNPFERVSETVARERLVEAVAEAVARKFRG